ncbi:MULTISPECIES: tryptophan 2,3-dioxygenase [unclassified Streptomyces]|uniref:tryptophan 2,3-dioxygenase n=1 Tax=unclassified Streptomyces TaxID=2593676 RepID=UPI0038065532
MVRALAEWRSDGDPGVFPYASVVDAYQLVGKHFVEGELLASLAEVRDALPTLRGAARDRELLASFLDTALDKRDGRYDYQTYLALGLLLGPADPSDRKEHACPQQRDRLTVQLIADIVEFELDALEGRTDLLPLMRPDARTVDKRCRLGMRAAGPALARLGLADPAAPLARTVQDGLSEQARDFCRTVRGETRPEERRRLMLSMLPAYTVHDEHLFIRVLQCFESTFATLAEHLAAAVEGLDGHQPLVAAERLDAATAGLREAAPLFSLLATMSVEAFQTFRCYTEGASAIQSRGYKTVESLCRRPDPDRVESAAFHSVPEVRARVLNGMPTLDSAFRGADEAGRLSPQTRGIVGQAMEGFSTALVQWRQTHYRLAVRMLGEERSGTGYTEGVPYLREARSVPVFREAPSESGRPCPVTVPLAPPLHGD